MKISIDANSTNERKSEWKKGSEIKRKGKLIFLTLVVRCLHCSNCFHLKNAFSFFACAFDGFGKVVEN
jgi:hypothetical protein